jgi:hypothetical protein
MLTAGMGGFMYDPSLLADITIPFQFGLLQVIILVIGLSGIALLIFVVLGLARGRKDKDGTRRRVFLWRRAISGSILMLIAISLIYLALLLQTYIGLTGEILAARVRAQDTSQLYGVPYMIVDLTLFDEHGNQLSETNYGICGNEWMLQADILRFPGWLNILGVHSGYKLTRLEGRYDDPEMESTWYHSVVELNGGDDNFFKSAYNGGWLSPFVQASYGSSVFRNAGVWNVYVSQDALTLQEDTSNSGGIFASRPIGSNPNDCRQLH